MPPSRSSRSATRERGAGDLGNLIGAVADEQAEEAVGGVDDREPGPAVAQEVLVERLLDAELARESRPVRGPSRRRRGARRSCW